MKRGKVEGKKKGLHDREERRIVIKIFLIAKEYWRKGAYHSSFSSDAGPEGKTQTPTKHLH